MLKKNKPLFGLLLLLVYCNPATAADAELVLNSTESITPVIELYTSEGCSSCPPADNFLTDLGETIDEDFMAVPLAFHVDYWNWLGWTDPYSSAKYTERQRFLADVNEQRSMYTPEILVAGKEARRGLDVVERVKLANSKVSLIDIMLSLKTDGDSEIKANLNIDNMASGIQAEAYVAIYENNIVRSIYGGENSGKTLTHNYVVRHWSDPVFVSPGKFNNQQNIRIDEDWMLKNLGLAVVVVNALTGETLQSLSTPLESLFSG